MNIQNKHCLVTGAGRGLGRQIALELADSGAFVHVCDITEDALENTRQDIQIEIKPKRIMGVLVPELDAVLGESTGGYSMIHTSPELDKAIAGLKAFLPKLLKMAELEETVRRLCREIEKTRRRVNALEHTFIPRMTETIKYIKNKLDEMERSTTSQLMKIKAQRLAQEQG